MISILELNIIYNFEIFGLRLESVSGRANSATQQLNSKHEYIDDVDGGRKELFEVKKRNDENSPFQFAPSHFILL